MLFRTAKYFTAILITSLVSSVLFAAPVIDRIQFINAFPFSTGQFISISFNGFHCFGNLPAQDYRYITQRDFAQYCTHAAGGCSIEVHLSKDCSTPAVGTAIANVDNGIVSTSTSNKQYYFDNIIVDETVEDAWFGPNNSSLVRK